jgi:hypothetical protein
MGDGALTLPSIDALSNGSNYHLFFAFSNSTCDPMVESVGRHLVTAEAGGSAGVIGFTTLCFPSTASDYLEAMLQSLVSRSAVPIGEAWISALQANAPSTFFNTSSRWTSLEFVVFGDPAMPFRSEVEPVRSARIGFSQLKRLFGNDRP